MARRRKEERRAGLASQGMCSAWVIAPPVGGHHYVPARGVVPKRRHASGAAVDACHGTTAWAQRAAHAADGGGVDVARALSGSPRAPRMHTQRDARFASYIPATPTWNITLYLVLALPGSGKSNNWRAKQRKLTPIGQLPQNLRTSVFLMHAVPVSETHQLCTTETVISETIFETCSLLMYIAILTDNSHAQGSLENLEDTVGQSPSTF